MQQLISEVRSYKAPTETCKKAQDATIDYFLSVETRLRDLADQSIVTAAVSR